MPQTTQQQQQQSQQQQQHRNHEEEMQHMLASFDPFAPPAHLSLDLAPVENLFGDSSSEHVSDPADELLYFGMPQVKLEAVQPPPMMLPMAKKARRANKTNNDDDAFDSSANGSSSVAHIDFSAALSAAAKQQVPQQFSVALPVPPPPPPPQHHHLLLPPMLPTLSTTILTEDDDEYAGVDEYASDLDESEDEKPRHSRRAAAKDAVAAVTAALREGSSSSADGELSPSAANKLKRKALAGIGAPPQRTQLTKAELELGATLELSRDELLNMTSEALEEHAKRLASQRSLTPEEQKRFKRQRRLIKNRESAQLSRMRKKAYVDELERQISDLKDEKDAVRRRADSAERQLAQLRAETAQLRALLSQHPALATLASDRAAVTLPEPPLEVSDLKRRRGAGGLTLL